MIPEQFTGWCACFDLLAWRWAGSNPAPLGKREGAGCCRLSFYLVPFSGTLVRTFFYGVSRAHIFFWRLTHGKKKNENTYVPIHVLTYLARSSEQEKENTSKYIWYTIFYTGNFLILNTSCNSVTGNYIKKITERGVGNGKHGISLWCQLVYGWSELRSTWYYINSIVGMGFGWIGGG